MTRRTVTWRGVAAPAHLDQHGEVQVEVDPLLLGLQHSATKHSNTKTTLSRPEVGEDEDGEGDGDEGDAVTNDLHDSRETDDEHLPLHVRSCGVEEATNHIDDIPGR